MSTKSKNIILLTVVLLLVLSLFTIVIYDAVMANRKEEILEIYIDTTPLDYTEDDKVIFSFKFTKSITDIASDLGMNSNNESLQKIISEMLAAMSEARIPADKLGKLADTIGGYSEDIVGYFTDNGELTEDEVEDFIITTKMQHIANFSNNFFKSSTLTEEEFSSALYQFMLKNASTQYKQAMYKLGKNDYVTFIANTLYLINTMGEIMESGKNTVSSTALQAVIYELGSNYIEILDKVGLSAIQTVLGFSWSYTGSDTRVPVLNTYTESLSDKLSYLFGIIGYTMKELTTGDIDILTSYLKLEEGRNKNDHLIYMESVMSKALLIGMLSSLKYLEDGITSVEQLFPSLKAMLLDAYLLRTTLSKDAESEETKNLYISTFDKFVESLIYFSDKELTLEEIQAMTEDETYTTLLNNAIGISEVKETLDDFIFNMLYVWVNNLLSGGNLEA